MSASPNRRRVPRLLPLLFAASGCAALIYQVVWFQLLSLQVGASAISLAVLLATFLGGLCLGSVLLPRFVPVDRHPLRVYALLELGVGVLGVAALYAVPAVGGLYTAWAGPGIAGSILRVVAAAVCLLPPTILMGATLPAVARLAGASPDGAARLGFLYAANIAGSVVGSLLAGFYLLRLHDVQTATSFAAALNLVAALASAALAARTDSEPSTATASNRAESGTRAAPPPPTATRRVYVTTALSGMTALSAEVLWTRELSLLLGSTVYAFALILAVFLLGLGLGSAAGAAVGRRFDPRAALGYAQLLLCAAMAWAAYAIARSLPYWPLDVTLAAPPSVTLQLDVLRTAFVVLPATLLWGASFPLALAAAAAAGTDPRRTVGRLYAVNTAGAIAGALLTTFVLVPALGGETTQRLAILIAAGAGLAMLARAATPDRRSLARQAAGVLAALVAAFVLARAVPPLPPELVAYGRFLPTRGANANVIYVGEGLTASIAVTREPSGMLTYHNQGKTQASTYPQDLRLQRMLGHLATLLADRPAKVLVIGLGAGITAGAVSVDPAVERVVVAEIEPLVPRAAAEYFAEPNFGVVANPKTEIRIDDGRHYLATSGEKFDAITSDPLDPWVKGAAALYTREFWQLCKSRLNDGGVVTAFLQLYESTDDAVKSEIATFFEVFPSGALFANTVDGRGYDAVLVARTDGRSLDVGQVQRRLASAEYERVEHSLREVGFGSAVELLGTYATRAADLAPWLDGAAINTDRDLRLQYLAGDGLNVYRNGEILDEIVALSGGLPAELFTGSPAQIEELRQSVEGRRAAQ